MDQEGLSCPIRPATGGPAPPGLRWLLRRIRRQNASHDAGGHRGRAGRLLLAEGRLHGGGRRCAGQGQATVLVQAYSFTSAPIAKALVDAHKRGVKVTVVLDKSQETEKYSSATFVANAGIPVFIDDKHKIARNKIILIDETTIITGSFNFTKAAEESNAENLLIIEGKPKLMAAYQKNFKEHREHSHEYERKE